MNEKPEHLKTPGTFLQNSQGLPPSWEQRLDNAVKRITAPPGDLAARIKYAVNSGAEESVPEVPRFRFQGILGYAAAAAVVLLGVVLLHGNGTRPEAELASAQPDMSQYILADSMPAAENMPVPAARSRTDVRAVSTGNAAKKTAVPRDRTTAELPPAIRHVWSAPDITEVTDFLKNVASVNGLTLQEETDPENLPGGILYTMVLKDTEVQDLVDKMSGRQWKLLKPELPQPGAADSVNFTGKTVDYRICLVQQE